MDGQLHAASDAVDYLAYAIAHTSADPAAAYVVTPARAWELGAGALLAAHPRCFGAAARDPEHPACINLNLRKTVVPRRRRRPVDPTCPAT
jgi:hypothetical protein